MDHLLNRIGEVDAAGPQLRAVIETNPAAMELAVARDAERRDGHLRSSLHGTPILIKDNIDTADDMLTTAGSLALMGSRPRADAPIVTRLRDAGMIVIGKTNLSEWAGFRSPKCTSGWSARGGLTRNPWDVTRSAGGSSSGSGAALAAGLAPFAIGTETDGSIVCPASYCGVVGLKPTMGVLPAGGVIPIAHSQDIAGPMARSVSGVAVLMDILTDNTTYSAAVTAPADSAAAGAERGVAGMRIGVTRSFFGHHTATDAVADAAISRLAAAGAEIVDPVKFEPLPMYDDGGSDELTVLLYEFKHDLDQYLAARPIGSQDSPRSLVDIVEFNRQNSATELQWFGQEFMEQAAALGGLDAPEYIKARSESLRLARDEGIDAVLKRHNLDALVSPAFPPAIMIDLVNGDAEIGGDATTAPAIAGYPILSVPMGLVHGLPVGLAVFGTAHSEPALLKIAASVERDAGLLAEGGLQPAI